MTPLEADHMVSKLDCLVCTDGDISSMTAGRASTFVKKYIRNNNNICASAGLQSV